MSLLTAEQILAAKDLKTKRVTVPGWGGEVMVRTLEGWERDKWEVTVAQLNANKNGQANGRAAFDNVRASLCALAICDESGKPLFNERQVAALGKKSAAMLDLVYEEAAKLSGIRKEDVEEALKNSNGIPNEDSGSN